MFHLFCECARLSPKAICCNVKGADEAGLHVYKNCVCVQLWVQADWARVLYDGQSAVGTGRLGESVV